MSQKKRTIEEIILDKKEVQELKEEKLNKLRQMINKKVGYNVAYNLDKEDPATVKSWIPTGSRWLDSITCDGKIAGIPIGRCSALEGTESSGKSYMALQIAKNAIDMGITPVYFDAESAIDKNFITRFGIDLNKFIYVQAESVEFVLQTIEDFMKSTPEPFLFILDSLAFCPCVSDAEGDYDPLSTIALKPRVLAKGFSKLLVPLARHGSTFLVCNQLKTNITSNLSEKFTDPYVVPGGRATAHAYSLRIWLTPRKSKDSFVYDTLGKERGDVIGTEIKAQIKKSRFGSYLRQCEFQILWKGDRVGIMDEESWIEAIKSSPSYTSNAAWRSVKHKDGTEEKFQESNWLEKLKEPKFRERILEMMDEVLIQRLKGTEEPKKESDIVE